MGMQLPPGLSLPPQAMQEVLMQQMQQQQGPTWPEQLALTCVQLAINSFANRGNGQNTTDDELINRAKAINALVAEAGTVQSDVDNAVNDHASYAKVPGGIEHVGPSEVVETPSEPMYFTEGTP